MNRRPIRLGLLALLLLVITVCMTTLGVLTVATAQADLRLAERYGEMNRQQYQRELAGQDFLRQADETTRDGLPLSLLEGVTETREGYEKTITVGNASLKIVLRTDGGDLKVVAWETDPQWNPETKTHKLWGG